MREEGYLVQKNSQACYIFFLKKKVYTESYIKKDSILGKRDVRFGIFFVITVALCV